MYVQPVLLGIRGLMIWGQTELAINTNTMVADMHRNALAGKEGASSGKNDSVGATCYPPTT
jgi:hypothetical protein